MSSSAAPAGCGSITPYLLVENVSRQIEFLKGAFGAVERIRMHRPDGSVQHAQVTIAESLVMMGEPRPPFRPMPASNYLYVQDADAVFAQALCCGAEAVIPLADQFYGDRMGGVRDPSGNLWWIASRRFDLSNAELEQRARMRT